MPLYFFYTMVQKSQKWPKTQIKGGGGGPALNPKNCIIANDQLSSTSLLLPRMTASGRMYTGTNRAPL